MKEIIANKLKTYFLQVGILIVLVTLGLIVPSVTDKAFAIAQSNYIYQERTIHNPDGIGKFYLGREIAQVMGHQGAGWLERPTREVEEKPSLVVKALNLKLTDVVADIGAGTGYFSFMIAPYVTKGKVLAVDIQPEMLEIIDFFKQEKNITNVQPILANLTSPNLLPESIDLALMVDVYHELEYPYEMMDEVVKALKPNGRVVLVEYRKENPFILIKGLHKMTVKQIKKEMSAVGLVWQETQEFLPQQHFIVFQKDKRDR
ncbi:MAG TPA: class I SAM-dependent methyltransferase [Oculatellaceae cyanobacterium]|jgi:ubiquinone/menaquinone biosynthesis C-methylase UbiE